MKLSLPISLSPLETLQVKYTWSSKFIENKTTFIQNYLYNLLDLHDSNKKALVSFAEYEPFSRCRINV